MEALRKKARELLESKAVAMVIGYGEAADKTVRAVFIRKPEDAAQLIYDKLCIQNLAFYFTKSEIREIGRSAVIAALPGLRTILQLASENQVKESNILVLGVTPQGTIQEFAGFKELEAYIAACDLDLPAKDREIIQKLESMTREERLKFWIEQLSRCIKCYACRAACPLCYCGRCQVEYNQPQVITVEATPLGNLEWHFMRAMHLAGRCTDCGDCGRACSLGIPIHLLTYKTGLTVQDKFGDRSGVSASLESIMSSFKSEDKENFFL
jgi:ferredoxin